MLAHTTNTVYSVWFYLPANILLYLHPVQFLFQFILNVLFIYRFLSLTVCYCTCTVLLHCRSISHHQLQTSFVKFHLIQLQRCHVKASINYLSVEPQFNKPLYNKVLVIMNNFLHPTNSKIYGKEPRYKEISLQ